jgi:hypothetical protein
MAQHGLEDVDEAADIDPVVVKRSQHRFPDIGERGEMDDGAGAVLREGGLEGFGIEHVGFDERAPTHELGVASREVIEGDRQEASRRERLAGVAADEAGAAGDENGLHDCRIPWHDPRLGIARRHIPQPHQSLCWPGLEPGECGGHHSSGSLFHGAPSISATLLKRKQGSTGPSLVSLLYCTLLHHTHWVFLCRDPLSG